MHFSTQQVTRALAIVAVIAAIACSWIPSIQSLANEQVNDGLKRALTAFAVAKTLNAAISVAQGTSLALQPAGFGVNLTLGEALDPLNDLVEQFASLMLTACVIFGIQKALLAIGAHWVISLAVTVVAIAWATLHFHGRGPDWLTRLLVVLVMVRFAIPVMTIGSDWAFESFMAKNYQSAQASLGVVTANASKPIATSEEAKGRNLWERIKEAWGNVDIKAKLADLQKAVDKATDHIIDLIVIFAMQTVVLPFILAWALLKMAAGVFASRPS